MSFFWFCWAIAIPRLNAWFPCLCFNWFVSLIVYPYRISPSFETVARLYTVRTLDLSERDNNDSISSHWKLMKATGPGLNETSVVAAGACWVADIVCCARSGGWPCGCRSLARTRTPWPRGTWHCTRCREGVETRSVLYSYTLLPHTWHLLL